MDSIKIYDQFIHSVNHFFGVLSSVNHGTQLRYAISYIFCGPVDIGFK